MQVIIPPIPVVEQIVGKQNKVVDQAYRLMSYVVQCPVDNGVLLYHTLMGTLLFLSKEEASQITSHPELIDLWFLVPDQNDDFYFCQQVHKISRLLKPVPKNINQYTILPSTGCNARCFYCFEKGTNPISMTQETADKVVNYIVAHRGKGSVKIRWFGGEPLINTQVIDRICSDLAAKNIPFKSSMVSNGYLFDESKVQKATVLWQLKKVQITIDGTKETYNKVKNYVYSGVNAFDRVLNNIQLLTDAGIHVKVRLNVDLNNIDEMSELVTQLYERFGNNKHLTVYSFALYGQQRTPSDNAALFDKRIQLVKKITEYGYRKERKLPRDIKFANCSANDDQSVIISPAGFLGKCSLYVDREFFGHIDQEEQDESIIQRFKKRVETPECSTCFHYPRCGKLVMCAYGAPCTPERRKDRLYKTIEAMKNEYRDFLGTGV